MQAKTIQSSSSDDDKASNEPIIFLDTTRKAGELKGVKNKQTMKRNKETIWERTEIKEGELGNWGQRLPSWRMKTEQCF